MKKGLKYHLVDSTAMLVESNPVFAAFEVGIVGMSDLTSLYARLIATATIYGGLGSVYGKGRDFSKKIFKITDQTKERTQKIHDLVYTAAFNLFIATIMYTSSQLLAKLTKGEDLDFGEIARGTGVAVVLGAINGIPMGYAVDAFRDLTGLKKCDRKSYPNLVKKQNLKIKKSLAGLLIGGSIVLNAGIYALTSDKESEIDQEPIKEIIADIPKKENLEEKTYYLNIK